MLAFIHEQNTRTPGGSSVVREFQNIYEDLKTAGPPLMALRALASQDFDHNEQVARAPLALSRIALWARRMPSLMHGPRRIHRSVSAPSSSTRAPAGGSCSAGCASSRSRSMSSSTLARCTPAPAARRNPFGASGLRFAPSRAVGLRRGAAASCPSRVISLQSPSISLHLPPSPSISLPPPARVASSP